MHKHFLIFAAVGTMFVPTAIAKIDNLTLAQTSLPHKANFYFFLIAFEKAFHAFKEACFFWIMAFATFMHGLLKLT